MGDLSGFAQLGSLTTRTFDGAGTILVDEEITWSWEDEVVTVEQTDSDVEVSVKVRREIITDTSDLDGAQRLGVDVFLAKSTDGNVYRLVFNADSEPKVDGLFKVADDIGIWAKGSMQLNETWFLADNHGESSSIFEEFELITQSPAGTSPSGFPITLVLGAVGNSDRRAYYDSNGLVEFGYTLSAGSMVDGLFAKDAAPEANN